MAPPKFGFDIDGALPQETVTVQDNVGGEPQFTSMLEGTLPVMAMLEGTLPVISIVEGTLPVISIVEGTLPVISIVEGTLPVIVMVEGTLPVISILEGKLPVISIVSGMLTLPNVITSGIPTEPIKPPKFITLGMLRGPKFIGPKVGNDPKVIIDGTEIGVNEINVGILTAPKDILDGIFTGPNVTILGMLNVGSMIIAEGKLNAPNDPKGFKSKQGNTMGGNVKVAAGMSILGITMGGNVGKTGTGISNGDLSGVVGGSCGAVLVGGVCTI